MSADRLIGARGSVTLSDWPERVTTSLTAWAPTGIRRRSSTGQRSGCAASWRHRFSGRADTITRDQTGGATGAGTLRTAPASSATEASPPPVEVTWPSIRLAVPTKQFTKRVRGRS